MVVCPRENPPVDGVVVLPAPKSPPAGFGADVVAPNKPPVAGVVDAGVAVAVLPNKEPPEEAGVALDPPPKRLPAGFGAVVLLCCPKSPPPAAGVEGLLLVPNENELPPEAPPNSPPVAGAVDVVLFDAAPEELAPPKLKDMAIVLFSLTPTWAES